MSIFPNPNLLFFVRSKQWAQMDIDEEIIRERENDIVELTK